MESASMRNAKMGKTGARELLGGPGVLFRGWANAFFKGGNHVRSRLRLLMKRRNGSSPFLRFFLPAIAAAALGPLPAWGGAWPREDGELYGKLSVLRFSADQVYAPKRNRKLAGPRFTDLTAAFYAEYGFTPRWTGVLSLP